MLFSIYAARPFMERIVKKKRFGGTVFPIGPFLTINTWVYQLGGLARFAFSAHPGLLGKLCVADPLAVSNAALEIHKGSTDERFDNITNTNPTFFDLHLFQEMERAGIKVGTSQGQRILNQDIKDPTVSDMIKLSFIEGACLGWIFPDTFEKDYQATYDSDGMLDTYEELARLGGVSGHPQRIPISESIAELRGSILEWSEVGDPVTPLDEEETLFLNATSI